MNWNPFKRIAALESRLATLIVLHDQDVQRINSMSIMLKDQDDRLVSLQNQLVYRTYAKRPNAPIGLTAADVEKEAKKRLQRAAYARKYYAKKRAAKAAEGGAK